MNIRVDLCGSAYDTKTYIYNENLIAIACNDDFYFDDDCGVYVSKIEIAEVMGGEIYFIVVDGYGGDSGDYVLQVEEYEPCLVYCPDDAVPEGEPPLHEGIARLCGKSGWYNKSDGVTTRDTVWIVFTRSKPA